MSGIPDHYLDAKWNEDMLGPTECQHPRFMEVPPEVQTELDSARAEFNRILEDDLRSEVDPEIWTARQVNLPPYYSVGVRRFHDHGGEAQKA